MGFPWESQGYFRGDSFRLLQLYSAASLGLSWDSHGYFRATSVPMVFPWHPYGTFGATNNIMSLPHKRQTIHMGLP